MFFERILRWWGHRGGVDNLTTFAFENILYDETTVQIGEGTHGTVYKIQYNGKVAVLKVLKPEGSLESFRQEVDQLLHLAGAGGSPVILAKTKFSFRLDRRTEDVKPIAFVASFCGDANLWDLLCEQRLKDEDLFRISVGIVEKMCEVAERGVVHNDLKSDNIIVSFENGFPEVHVIDFGMGCLNGVNQHLDQVLVDNDPEVLDWMDPSVLAGGESTLSADVYSVGVMLAEIGAKMTNRPSGLLQVVKAALQQNAIDRPTMHSISQTLKAMSIPT
ncbi:probable serine/threonine-protein kinase DDB_G0267514 [Homarus americanus]|uniref:probable serine/threonine-protein kinase DDB_G0267514 n=1 Tax=Homarus americanus TaxID=6706 RepID=UPI001C449F6E|nr:probable serine/threonine-protein kinase DDB_G0267514 [Homarus americanus]